MNQEENKMDGVNLEVSFYGPFVFTVGPETVRAYVPRCEGHLASVQTDVDEKALLGCGPDKATPVEYKLRNLLTKEMDYGASGARLMQCCNPQEVILVESWRKLDEPGLEECYFQLEVPRPDFLAGLIADDISIVEYDLPEPGNGSFAKKATAMRFYYTNLDPATKLEVVQTVGEAPRQITVLDLRPPYPQRHAPIAFRYTSNSIFDPDHRDAEECFMRMRALFPALGAWKVDFDDAPISTPPSQPKPHLLRMGGDCKSSPIVFVTYEEKERWLPGSAVKPPSSFGPKEKHS
jgi:hypothetical protein